MRMTSTVRIVTGEAQIVPATSRTRRNTMRDSRLAIGESSHGPA